MSLEEALNQHAELLKQMIATNEKIIGLALKKQGDTSSTAAASTGDEKPTEKPKTTRAKKEDTKADGAVTKADLITKFKTWLNEFGASKDAHPECAARYELLAATLAKVGGDGFTLKALGDDDQEKIDKLNNWFETKVKTADKGFGIGRLAADPAPADEDGEDDGLGV